MRFADKRYYIEAYVKCANCGVLIYDTQVTAPGAVDTVYCSDWCREWQRRRAESDAPPELPLPKVER